MAAQRGAAVQQTDAPRCGVLVNTCFVTFGRLLFSLHYLNLAGYVMADRSSQPRPLLFCQSCF